MYKISGDITSRARWLKGNLTINHTAIGFPNNFPLESDLDNERLNNRGPGWYLGVPCIAVSQYVPWSLVIQLSRNKWCYQVKFNLHCHYFTLPQNLQLTHVTKKHLRQFVIKQNALVSTEMNLEETQFRRNTVTLFLTTAGFSTGEKYLTNT